MQGTAYADCDVLVGSLKLHYQEWGDESGAPMILLHGFGLSGHMFDEFAATASARYHMFCLDQRGHGDSEWSQDGDYSREAFVADLEGLRAALDLESFILVGHSMGGLNAVAYAKRFPERVERLVLVDVGPEAVREGVDNIMRFTRGPDNLEFEQYVEMAHRFNPRRSLDNIRDRMRHRLRPAEKEGRWTWKFDSRFREPASGIRVGSSLKATEMWQLFREVPVPTLLVRGGESDVLSQEVAERVVSEMPRARLVVIPEAGHSVPGDAPVEFTTAVLSFLAEDTTEGGEGASSARASADTQPTSAAAEAGAGSGAAAAARDMLRAELAASELPLPRRRRRRRSGRTLLVVVGAAAVATVALVLGVRAISRSGDRSTGDRARRRGKQARREAAEALGRAAAVFDEVTAAGRQQLAEMADLPGAAVATASGTAGEDDGVTRPTAGASGRSRHPARSLFRLAGRGAGKAARLAAAEGRGVLRPKRRGRKR